MRKLLEADKAHLNQHYLSPLSSPSSSSLITPRVLKVVSKVREEVEETDVGEASLLVEVKGMEGLSCQGIKAGDLNPYFIFTCTHPSRYCLVGEILDTYQFFSVLVR